MRPVQKVSSHVIWKIETFIEEDTRYNKHCTWDSDASVPFKVMTFLRKSGSLVALWIKSLATAARWSFCSGSRSHGTSFATTCFTPKSCIKISDTVVFGIPRSASGSYPVSHWFLLIAAHKHSTFSGVLLVAGLLEHGSLSTDSWPSWKCLCHPFISASLFALSLKAFWIIWIVSAEECSTLTKNFMQFRCSTRSVILFVTATQYTCSLNGIYQTHWLVQWSRHCSHMRIPVHSPWLPGCIDVVQTVLIILTWLDFFWTDLVYLTVLPCVLVSPPQQGHPPSLCTFQHPSWCHCGSSTELPPQKYRALSQIMALGLNGWRDQNLEDLLNHSGVTKCRRYPCTGFLTCPVFIDPQRVPVDN